MSALPASWQEVAIVDVLAPNDNGKAFQQGWSPKCEQFPAPEGAWGVLKTTAIQRGEFWPHENKALPEHLDPRPQIEVKAGDIVMTCAGPRNRCGVACLVEHPRPRLMLSGKMYRFRPHPDGIEPKYLAYLIQRHETQLEIDRMKTGINDSGLNLTHDRFAALRLPLAPLREQHRIVAKIEELFSELDKAVESLTLARAQLKAYRLALLKAAFEGKLTADWRAANPASHTDRPAQKAEIPDDLEAACGDHWVWLRLGDIGRVTGGLTKNAKRNTLSLQMKYLRVANVYADRLDLAEIKEIGVTSEEWENLKLAPGDLMVVEGNGSVDQIGRVAMWSGEVEDVGHQNHLIRVRLAPEMSPRFFLTFLMSPLGRELIVRRASSTSGLHTLSISKVSGLPVPAPHPDEQALVLERLAAPLSQVGKQIEEIDTSLAKAESLRQSVLKKAFSGHLVAQDPTDEPAAALLARLREEAPTPARRRKTA